MFPRLLFQGFFTYFLKKRFFNSNDHQLCRCLGPTKEANVFRPHIRETVWKYKFLNNEYKLPIQKTNYFIK